MLWKREQREIRSSQAASRRRGLTLAELLIAVGVLGFMILGFSVILAQSQKLVVGTQDSMRANITAATFEQVIRRDLVRANRNGFLSIVDGDAPSLVLTVSGVQRSVTGDSSSLGSVVTYGLCENLAVPAADRQDKRILFRQGWVLSSDKGADGKVDTDQWEVDLDQLELTGSPTKDAFLGKVPNELRAPPATLDDVTNYWQVLAPGCTSLAFEWTSGQGSLSWQDTSHSWAKGDEWPAAIRVTFALSDSSLPEEFRKYKYEMVCPVGP